MAPTKVETDPKEYKWQVELVQERYNYLQLTFEQAEQVFRYEEEIQKTFQSVQHSFSMWEKKEYELSVFENVLQEDQLKKFKRRQLRDQKFQEQMLQEQDLEYAKQVAFQKELLRYYQEDFLPALRHPIFSFPSHSPEKSKINYLKQEYNKFLQGEKAEILVHHFRYSKTYQPLLLELSLLRHQLRNLYPCYASFKSTMDEPTKAVATYVKSLFGSYLKGEVGEYFTQLEQELQNFRNSKFNEIIGVIRGWHTVVHSSNEELEENRLMSLLLYPIK